MIIKIVNVQAGPKLGTHQLPVSIQTGALEKTVYFQRVGWAGLVESDLEQKHFADKVHAAAQLAKKSRAFLGH